LDNHRMATLDLQPQVFATTVVNGLATLNQSATGLSTNDSAQANADMPSAIGIQGEVAGGGEITVAGAGSVLGRVTGSQSAIAGSINSDSAANASIAQAIGISQPAGESIAVGATGSILGTVDLNQQARSTSVAASANADAITAAAFGIAINADSGSISTGGSGSIQGLALINTSAVATTVGNNAALDGATAVQQLGTAAGLDLTASTASAPTVVIGGLGEVIGAVAASGSATASTTGAGNSSATAGTYDPVTDVVGTLSGLRTTFGTPAVQVAGVASVSGSVNADFKAIASSVLGTAEANVNGSAMAIGDPTSGVGGGQISIGDDGVFSASADLTSIAQAGTTNGDATARIASIGQSVVGTALDGNGTIGLSIGGNGRLTSSATARQIGSSSSTNGSATTSFEGAGPSFIQGISSSDIAVGGSITGLDATASLIANGSATAVLGAASAEATSGYRTVGFDQAALSVAGSSSGGIRASGDAAVQLIAQSTNGDATTFLQEGDARGLSIISNPGGILIGRDADRLDADARQTIRMAASSVNGNLAQAVLGDMRSYGAEDGPAGAGGGGGISVGASAVVDITSTNLVDLSANNVGSSSSNGEAKATLLGSSFGSEAARQIGISIADQGLIQATATSAGRLAAQSVNGNASAIVDPSNSFTTIGIVGSDDSGIAAGADGDIRAAARMHGTGGSNTPYLLQATSASGNADASFDSAGGDISTVAVTTFINGTTINTGTATGDLSADATSSVGLYATSTSGNATASFAENAAGKSQVSAIVDSDVRAGSSGRNRVDANAALDLLLNAQTVNGAATATGNSAVYGITDGFTPTTGGDSIQLAGDISAQARFSNTALARSVQGTATSTANNANVLGVNGYDLTLIGSGGLTGAAHGLMRADAGSVDGNAQANALL
jgi:hypothetical protein